MGKGFKPAPVLFTGAAVVSALVTVSVMAFMLLLSLPVIRSGQLGVILSGPWAPGKGQFGIPAMMVGTMCIAGLSLILSFPLSLGCAFFIDIIKPKGAQRVLEVLVRIMTAVPTVIYGFVGVFLLVPQMRALAGRGSGMTILTAAIMLSLLIAPTMILFFSQSFGRVPKDHVLGADALGATPFQKLIYVILPAAWPGMLTGVILAFGRAMGDTLIALMLSGNSVMMPASALDSGRTLTAHIALILAADFDSLEFRTIFICGALLYLATTTAVLGARLWEGAAAVKKGLGWGDKFLVVFSWASAAVLVTALGLVVGFVVIKGGGTLGRELIFGTTRVMDALLLKRQVFDGLFPAVAGTLALVCLAMAVALPLGLATGIYLSEYARGPVKGCFSLLVDILAGIPSIVVGLFGFSITIFLHHFFQARIFPCLLISGLSLGFLVLPYIVKTTQAALEGLPASVRLTAPSLGASRLENLFYVLLPAALCDIFSGIVLAIGRCAEDTAVIMLTGVVATAGIPKSLFAGYEALPFYIYYIASEYTDPSELGKGFGAALILLILCTGLFALAHWIRYYIDRKMRYRH